jgi:hypothetical protein
MPVMSNLTTARILRLPISVSKNTVTHVHPAKKFYLNKNWTPHPSRERLKVPHQLSALKQGLRKWCQKSVVASWTTSILKLKLKNWKCKWATKQTLLATKPIKPSTHTMFAVWTYSSSVSQLYKWLAKVLGPARLTCCIRGMRHQTWVTLSFAEWSYLKIKMLTQG